MVIGGWLVPVPKAIGSDDIETINIVCAGWLTSAPRAIGLDSSRSPSSCSLWTTPSHGGIFGIARGRVVSADPLAGGSGLANRQNNHNDIWGFEGF